MYRFGQDHAKSNLIWNFKTREELRDCLESEMRAFNIDRELGSANVISWNHHEFEVKFNFYNTNFFFLEAHVIFGVFFKDLWLYNFFLPFLFNFMEEILENFYFCLRQKIKIHYIR